MKTMKLPKFSRPLKVRVESLVRLGIKSAIADAYWKLSWSKFGTTRMKNHSTIFHNAVQSQKVNFFADYVGRSGWNGMNCKINCVPNTITVQKSNNTNEALTD